MVLPAAVALLLIGTFASAGPPDGPGTYDELESLFLEYQALKTALPGDGIPDYSPAAIERRRAEVDDMQQRLLDMGVSRWSVPQQVDYLTVRAEFDQYEFILRVTRPWSRDPVFYIADMLPVAFTELPVRGDDLAALERALRAIPPTLEGARHNLTEVAADYADLAIRSLTLSDGVENGYPYRNQPPPGVIGWFEDLLARADAQPGLRDDIRAALAALGDFHQWLTDNRDSMTGLNGVGREKLDWFVRNGLLLPYSSGEMAVLSERELERMWAFYALERHRNRELPELEIAGSRESYQQRLESTDELLRDWLRDEEFISIPDHIPEDWREMGYNVPWIVRTTPPNFWEQVQFRDPSPDHLHAVIPGHRFDARVAATIDNPIRSAVNFGARWQGWAVYLEEAALQAGALESRPRTRELIYGAPRARSATSEISGTSSVPARQPSSGWTSRHCSIPTSRASTPTCGPRPDTGWNTRSATSRCFACSQNANGSWATTSCSSTSTTSSLPRGASR
jgi:hypothetical protein